MSLVFYGLQKRFLKSKFVNIRYFTGVTEISGVGNEEEQETISFRGDGKVVGEPVLESFIDPYAGFLRRTTALQLDRNNKSNLVTPIVVGGKTVAYNPHVDNGHAFRTRKRSVRTTANDGFHFIAPNPSGKRFGGPYFATNARIAPGSRGRMPFDLPFVGGTVFGKLPFIEPQSDLTSYGKKAIVALAPGFPDVSLFASGGELLFGFPSFIGKSLAHSLSDPSISSFFRGGGARALSKGAAGEFLNLVFGILPTIDDTIELVDAFRHYSERLLLLERNSGHGVRKNMTFTIAQRSEDFNSSELMDQGIIDCGTTHMFGQNLWSSNQGVVYKNTIESSLTMTERRRIRFSGSFTRFLPTAPGLEGTMFRFLKEWDLILGTKPSVSRIWQLIPFSWLVDWFLNIQQSLQLYERISDDSLLINYGYVTGLTSRTIIQRSTITCDPGFYPDFGSKVATTYNSVIKERVRANPFGFITPGEVEISPLRLAILAAIGLTGSSQN